MIVVADSSPFIALINIEQINVLPALFQEVIAPPQVIAELQTPNRPPEVRTFIITPPPWLIERAPTETEEIATLHAGEAAAISLARELQADLLLIDELGGRRGRDSSRHSTYGHNRRIGTGGEPGAARFAGSL